MSLKLFASAGSIYAIYLTSNIISQKLYSSTYPSIVEQGVSHTFEYPSFLVWVESLICGLIGLGRHWVAGEAANPVPFSQQLVLGSLYTIHILAANYALLYISFPSQVLGMYTRYLAAVLVGVYLSRLSSNSPNKLKKKKIVVAVLATIGAVGFSYFKGIEKQTQHYHDPSMAWLGYLMVAFAVLSDAFFLDNQAYCKSKYKPTSNHMLTSANLFTFAICLGHSFLQGTLYDEIRFCIEHPTVNIEIILLSLLQSFGQVAIYFIITNFKQHMFPLVSMTRKIMTILLSIFIYGHAVNVTQWLCICLVFGSLSYELFEEVVLLNKAEQNKIKDKQQ